MMLIGFQGCGSSPMQKGAATAPKETPSKAIEAKETSSTDIAAKEASPISPKQAVPKVAQPKEAAPKKLPPKQRVETEGVPLAKSDVAVEPARPIVKPQFKGESNTLVEKKPVKIPMVKSPAEKPVEPLKDSKPADKIVEEKEKQVAKIVSKPTEAAAVLKQPRPRTEVNVAAEVTAIAKTSGEVPSPALIDENERVVTRSPEFNLDLLPIDIKDNWILSADDSTCSLQTIVYTLNDGNGETPVSMVLTANNWLLKTDSNLDAKYPESGLRLDTGVRFEPEEIVNETQMRFSQQYDALNEALKSAKTLTLNIGFWPSWPATEAKSVVLSVDHFESAYATWKTCNQHLTAQ